MLLDQAGSVLAAPGVVLPQPPVLGLQTAALVLDPRHLGSHVVQVALELVLHLPRQAGAVVADLLQVLSLFLTGELEGDVMGEERVNLAQEGPGDIGDATQRFGKVLLALDFVGGQLLLHRGFVPPQADGVQVDVVPLFGDLLHLHPRHLRGLGEVGLHHLDHGCQMLKPRLAALVTAYAYIFKVHRLFQKQTVYFQTKN